MPLAVPRIDEQGSTEVIPSYPGWGWFGLNQSAHVGDRPARRVLGSAVLAAGIEEPG